MVVKFDRFCLFCNILRAGERSGPFSTFNKCSIQYKYMELLVGFDTKDTYVRIFRHLHPDQEQIILTQGYLIYHTIDGLTGFVDIGTFNFKQLCSFVIQKKTLFRYKLVTYRWGKNLWWDVRRGNEMFIFVFVNDLWLGTFCCWFAWGVRKYNKLLSWGDCNLYRQVCLQKFFMSWLISLFFLYSEAVTFQHRQDI